uniref:Transmembrane protein n=1 Tax=Panagrolaimus sp. PS1159 TaxID=55785 RepID=A0AC35GNH2_9BILA
MAEEFFNKLNKFFTLLFLSWCFAVLIGIPYIGFKEYTLPLWIFYVIVFGFVLLHYIYSTQKSQQKHVGYQIYGVIGFTIFTIVHFVVVCYYIGQMDDADRDHREIALAFVFGFVPTLSNGFFGGILTSLIYFQKKHSNNNTVNCWQKYVIIGSYSALSILMSTFLLIIVYTNKNIAFRQEFVISDIAIIIGAMFIILASVKSIRAAYFGGLIILSISLFVYGKLFVQMINYIIESLNQGRDFTKSFVWFMLCYTILIFVITGMYICYLLGKKEILKTAELKINVITDEKVFPAPPFFQKY